ncbi:MAG: hypothetical protein HFG73_10215 [Hungatella sp.]|nr:hypothetical protein [Hungatella sp.]
MRRRDFRAGYRRGYNAGFSDGWNMSMRSGGESGCGGCGRKEYPCSDEYVTGAELGDGVFQEMEQELDGIAEE